MARLIRLATIRFSFYSRDAMLLRQRRQGGEHERSGGLCPSRVSGRDRLARGASWRCEPRRARLHDASDPKITYTVKPGREDFEKGHIPGAEFIDLQADLSDNTQTKLRFMLPPPGEFAAAMRRFGISDDSKVVTYSTANPQWATRVWWVLRVYGFDNAAVLNGG